MSAPIRVVAFFGPFELSTKEFLYRLDAHPETRLVGAFCQGEGESTAARVRDVWRRRGLLAPGLLAAAACGAALRWVRSPRAALEHRRGLRRLADRLRYVPDLHAPAVLEEVRALEPDLGAIYGGPILRPPLFGIPRLGTLGIHHGRLPGYRGKKTTFWEMYEGEESAGVTIQRVNAGIDTGEVVAEGAVRIGRRAYGAVWREVQRLGIELYLESILAMGRGTASPRAASGERGPLRRDPRIRHLLTLWWRRLAGRRA